mgnify:CR=1 FL=1
MPLSGKNASVSLTHCARHWNLPEWKNNNTYRLVHGEGDNLPGLVIDMYAHTAVMQAHSVGMHYARHQIAEALKAVLGDSLQNIYYKSEATLPYKANLGSEDGYLYGGEVEDSLLRTA